VILCLSDINLADPSLAAYRRDIEAVLRRPEDVRNFRGNAASICKPPAEADRLPRPGGRRTLP
jgi:hypothetical protein